jgi:pimeloyl-ACP methyl ester carboxylesterase
MTRLGTDERGAEYGKTFFVGGAGGIGDVVGTVDVPKGLRQAKYRGAIEVFGWQSTLGGTLRDVMDRSRNEREAARLAGRIEEYLDQNPGRRVNIIALSAGTGIATWALEALPAKYHVGTVVYLASALSQEYDLSWAMRHIDGHLYCFCSTHDPVLRLGLPLTGSVDREWALAGSAGLDGFVVPPGASEATQRLYAEKLRVRPYRSEYARHGYFGFHTDCTSPSFIAHVVYPLLKAE